MNEIKIPTVGRIVHYFPNGSDLVTEANGADFLPALVIQSWDNTVVNLQVFTMNGDAPNVLRYSVPHRQDPGDRLQFWDWPEIK